MTEDQGLADVIRVLRGGPLPALDMYKEKCLRRRLAVRMRAMGVPTLADYARLLEDTPEEVHTLLNTLTINVTHFFRNPEVWDTIARPLEAQLRVSSGPVRCWSAGCATGEEPYTMAMLVAELADATGNPTWLSRCEIDATDIDDKALAHAQAGVFAGTSFGLPLSGRAKPFVQHRRGKNDQEFEVVPAIRKRVRFIRHDLGKDVPPHPPYNFILCRNVVIYFERDVQEALFGRFADALVPGGFLLLGKVEGIIGAARDDLVPENLRARLYRRTA